MSKYSIFRHNDSETAENIQKLTQLSKSRIFVVRDKANINKEISIEEADKTATEECKQFELQIRE